ncbi:MAG: hypothetical protein KGS61_13780, partial [Verrucomicrobia bacterium]|nr:hypothetical protein [Verrucomicrobiota bacterium]
FTHLMYGLDGVHQFQFRQLDERRVLLKYVRDSGFAAVAVEVRLRELTREIERYLGEQVTVQIEEVPEIHPTASGKHRFTISDLSFANV